MSNVLNYMKLSIFVMFLLGAKCSTPLENDSRRNPQHAWFLFNLCENVTFNDDFMTPSALETEPEPERGREGGSQGEIMTNKIF